MKNGKKYEKIYMKTLLSNVDIQGGEKLEYEIKIQSKHYQ